MVTMRTPFSICNLLFNKYKLKVIFHTWIYLLAEYLIGVQGQGIPVSVLHPSSTYPLSPPLHSPFTLPQGVQKDLSHHCVRDCSRHGEPRRCHYEFKIEWYVSMSKACYKCPQNSTDCARHHCVATDGLERSLITANRRLPGPSIQVCQNDEIIVDIENDLGSDTTSIHWHGLHMRGTPYMDGVPFVTQCPIMPGTSFRYQFLADLPGTHYWHSHSGFQRTDGLFGSLVIRTKNDPHMNLYDIDDPNHVIVLTDWMDKLGIDKFVNHHHTTHENKPYNILVNGMGRFKPIDYNGNEVYTPLYEFSVKKGLRYRFRVVSNSIQNCPIIVSLDRHKLTLISSDAHDIQPLEVDSFVIYGGERWDFIVQTDGEIKPYWFKFNGLLDCDERFKSASQLAVLRYEGSTGLPTAIHTISYEDTKREGLQVNKLNSAPGDYRNFLTAAELQRLKTPEYDISGEPDHKFWMEFDFYSKDNDLFHHEDFYPFFGVEKSLRLYVPQVNHITFKFPPVPPLSQGGGEGSFCNSTSMPNCKSRFCHCPHVLHILKDDLVEVILVDTGIVYWANHPFHLHGNAFAVLAMGRLGEETTLQAVKDQDSSGKIVRNFDSPPLKDTVTVPDGGFTVIRFRADNPGYWLFHCHISFHAETGMGLVFHVGDDFHLPPVPNGFPKCGNWLPKTEPGFRDRIHHWNQNVKNNLYKKGPTVASHSVASSATPNCVSGLVVLHIVGLFYVYFCYLLDG